MNGLRLGKLEEISNILRQNFAALFFDIAAQALDGFVNENTIPSVLLILRTSRTMSRNREKYVTTIRFLIVTKVDDWSSACAHLWHLLIYSICRHYNRNMGREENLITIVCTELRNTVCQCTYCDDQLVLAGCCSEMTNTGLL